MDELWLRKEALKPAWEMTSSRVPGRSSVIFLELPIMPSRPLILGYSDSALASCANSLYFVAVVLRVESGVGLTFTDTPLGCAGEAKSAVSGGMLLRLAAVWSPIGTDPATKSVESLGSWKFDL